MTTPDSPEATNPEATGPEVSSSETASRPSVPSGTRLPDWLTRRRVVYGLCWLLLVVGALGVPMPYFAVAPGSAIEVADLVVVEGHEVTEIDGSAALLAVSLRRPSLVDWILASLDDQQELVPIERYLPAGQEDEDYFDDQALVFDDAFAVAAVVALEEAGFPVTFRSAPLIVGVLPYGPAGGVLESGDLVLEINGVDLTSAGDLVAQARRLRDGDVVDLVIERDGEVVEASMTAGQVERMERPGLGVTVDTAHKDISLPFDVRLDDDVRIGGPSAGLLFALTVYDLVAEEDLLAGRRVAGTGTIAIDGAVGRIGSVPQKVATAIRDGYEVILVPASHAAEARDAAGDDILVLPVGNFREAVEALRNAPLPS